MDPQRFVSDEYGHVAKHSDDKWAFWFYRPNTMPRELNLSADTVLALSRADRALGRLSGTGRLLKDPSVLLHPYMTREAVSSSRIEGTVASLSEVFQAEASDEPSEDEEVNEVLNYQRALDRGLKLLESTNMGIAIAREVHRVLLTGVRGEEKKPGEFRDGPVWIGSATDSPETAAFVPPTPDHLDESLADWDDFIRNSRRLPPLVRCALMHYQFETIHPFFDGNGRVGRLLIILMLTEQQLLPTPLLYVSPYMEARRREYYGHLQAVREEGRLEEWIQFFLTAVEKQAEDAENRVVKLFKLREHYRNELLGTRSRAIEVVELLFSNPFLTVRRVERALNITNQGARNLIEAVEKRGWISRIGSIGRAGRLYWVGDEVFETIQ
ncbi:Fic family protein [Streptosporangium sp. V21-05]|uniref:Fic family protein n=1 Tax=Streptosporangium sp. V21-05 TaxID=3446115 RepID=UPI003F52AEB9